MVKSRISRRSLNFASHGMSSNQWFPNGSPTIWHFNSVAQILWPCFVMATDVAGALVLEVGSSMCRVGFAQEDVPSAVFPSLVGRIRHPALMQVVPGPKESFGRF